jgi:galactokinase
VTVVDGFAELFGELPSGVWSGPGRVNLIGEHTDYNDGFVLPIAIDRRASVAVRLRADRLVQCASRQRASTPVVTSLGDLHPGSVTGWPAYVLGVAWALMADGVDLPGFDLLLDSDVPIGAGLSSSAAIETATALALSDLVGALYDRTTLALTCHRAETTFVGAPVGVMDQMVSACATPGMAMLLDCRSLETTDVPFDPTTLGAELLVIVTGAGHQNNDGAYAERRAACETAAAQLGLRALREASYDEVAHLPRARHVVSECARVLAMVDALKATDAVAVGSLIQASHVSLRDDFEVSCPELDVAVESALSAGAHGARLTGAGFGGSAITLVPAGSAPDVARTVQEQFAARGFSRPEIFAVTAGPGADRHDLPACPSRSRKDLP